MLVQDESTFALGGNRARYGWYRRGRPGITTPATLSRDRKHAFGVLGRDASCFMFYDTVGSDAFIDFLDRVRRRFGPALIFTDNAAWHKSAAVRRHVGRRGSGIRLEYLPPYTPELNAIETQWRVMKNAAGNRVYRDTGELVRSVRAMIRRREIVPVKMNDYLTC